MFSWEWENILKGYKMKLYLKAKPFYLSYEDIKWVEETLAGLTLDEKNVRRITWNLPMRPEIPWYVTELPTVCVSIHNPFHLIDVPMVLIYINTYSDNDEE